MEEKKKKENKKGWFSFSSAKKEDLELNEDDYKKLENYLNETFQDDGESAAAKMDELSYKKILSLNFFLQGGSFYFSNITADKNEEGVSFYYQGLSAKVDMTSKSQHVKLALKDYGLLLQTRYANQQQYITLPILRRTNYWLPPDQSGSMIEILFESNPQGKEEGTYIDLNSQAVEIVFRPVAIDRLTSFFDVKTEDENLKSQAVATLQEAQEAAK
mmetsp:Transcript_20209/g.17396  ORF Transcript_20209/g.17396 Transcript_20209/m.17396 type:complete len:216 (+) Transcript_20209:1246-1893(+)